MRITELISEQQTIGSIGSSTMPTSQPVQSVSQTTAPKTPGQGTDQKQDPNSAQLSTLLKQNQINVNSVDDFLNAYTAVQQKQQLNPEQEKTLGAFTKAVVAKPGLTTQIAGLMKTLSTKQQQPGATPQGAPASGTIPPATPGA
jgi:hypothetical protein